MIVLVTGGRDFTDRERLFVALDTIQANTPIGVFIHGCAKGADKFAREWVDRRSPESICDIVKVSADWKAHGRAAGPKRNAEMVAFACHYADGHREPGARARHVIVLACPGGRGTADCVRQAKEAGLRVMTLDEALAD